MPELNVVAAALFGLLIGSFLNVCIYRWPRDLSVVAPRSRCPECERPIAWFDNIPAFSFLLLGGRCRNCKTTISPRYPIVELLTAALFGYFVYHYGLTPEAARWCVLSAILITLGFADAETLILPDQFTLGGIVVGLLFNLWIGLPDLPARTLASALDAFLGIMLPAGSLWLGGFLFEKIRHKEGLGFGDVKMTAMLGAFLGLKGALLTLVIGSTLGSVIGLAYIAITRKDAASYQLPLGTFLAIGGLAYALVGTNIIRWYAAL